jgi:hypothetical protein
MAQKILSITAKCSDLCSVGYSNEKFESFEKDGYVPKNIGIGGDDYIRLEIDIETGKILNWNVTEEQIIEALTKE